MTVEEVAAALDLRLVAGAGGLQREIKGGYVSDLLSNVMGRAQAGAIWVTMQGHQNIVAVAALAGLAGIILAGGVQPEQEALAKAHQEGIPLLLTPLSGFDVVGRLYEAGIRGG